MSEWERVRLAEVVALDIEAVRVQATARYSIVGVLNRGRGLLFREPIGGDDTSYQMLNRIRPDQIVYSRLKAFEGAITVAPNGLGEAYASQEFPTFTCSERILPQYFRLLTTTKRLWNQLQILSTGMGGRRERVKPADFLTIEMGLPSLSEQRRIIDVIATVDAQIEALSAELSASQAALGPLISDLLSQGGAHWPLKRLDQVGTFMRGRRFTKADYVKSGLSAIHYGQIHTDLGLITTEALTYLPDHFHERMRFASKGDVVIAATSENVQDLGNATVWLGDGDAAVHDDANIFKHDLDPVFAGCLFFSPAFQQQKVQYAAGTKVTRISGNNLGRIEVPIPTDRGDQERIGGAVRTFASTTDSLNAELSKLRALRSSILTSLLDQEIEIPESYDALNERSS